MNIHLLIRPFPWALYSKKFLQKLQSPRSCGFFSKTDAESSNLRLAIGAAGDIEEGNKVMFYWLVDPEDGKIMDCKYQVYGDSALIGAAEVATTVVIGKNYDQARRLSLDVMDKSIRDTANTVAIPEEILPHFSLISEALIACSHECMDIPLEQTYESPPIPEGMDMAIEGEGIAGFKDLPLPKKIALIEEVLQQEIRPYIEMDGGGVEILSLEGSQVFISYQGACETCFSAAGATLSFIQKVLRAKLDKDLVVIPNL